MAYSQEEINELYQKQRKQIYKKIRRLESRGYIVSKDILPKSLTEIRKEGKEPTIEDVEHLRQVKTKEIYEKTYYEARDLETGDKKTLTYEERRKQELSEAGKKAAETRRNKKKPPIPPPLPPIPPELPEEDDIIIDKILSYIYLLQVFVSTAKNPKANQKNTNNVNTAGDILETELNQEINKDKKSLIARLKNNADTLTSLLSKPYNFYEEPSENNILSDILTVIKDSPVSFDEMKNYSENIDDELSEEDYDDLPF